MSQGFKLKFDQMRNSDPTNPESLSQQGSKAHGQIYPEESHVRNICFVWLDGKRLFLNYSYMVGCEYLPEENTIILTFTSHTLVLKGVNLEGLFYDLMHHLPKQITCKDARYNMIGEDEKFSVNEINVIKNS